MTDSLDSALATNRAAWNHLASTTQGRTALPRYGPLSPTEDELGLLGDVRGLKVLEIGCGDGQSLVWLGGRGAGELWGLDLSDAQIETARQALTASGIEAKLICSPMEHDSGLPADYFDLAISIYALGWAVDLSKAVGQVAGVLKPGGRFVFSWEHPVYTCMKSTPHGLVVGRPYREGESGPRHSWQDQPIVLRARTVSTFVNALAAAGLVIERMVEGEFREDTTGVDYPRRWYSRDRARLMPTTLIIAAKKPGRLG